MTATMPTNALEPASFETTVLFADTDAGGMVYFGSYARFVENAVRQWFDFNKHAYLGKKNNFWVVRRLNVLYSESFRYGDLLEVNCDIDRIRRYSLDFKVNIRAKNRKTKNVAAMVTFALIDLATHKPLPMPHPIFSHSAKYRID